MHAIFKFVPLTLGLIPSKVFAFVPQQKSCMSIRTPRKASIASKTEDILGDAPIDIQHAKYCVNHFGACSLEDMEHLRNALHLERISHMAAHQSGVSNPHGLPSEIEKSFLEKDLTLQLGLLQDKLATEHMQKDSLLAIGKNPYPAMSKVPLLDGTLDEESSETLLICLAIAALALLPHLF